MQAIEHVGNEVLRQKIAQSVDVSGFSDNCFFHSLALYLLGNKIPLPNDLFDINDNDRPQIKALKTRFPNQESLDFFEQYATLKFPDANEYHNHLVEKTMVLGIFFRSWFFKNLEQDVANREALFNYKGAQDVQGVDENHITFMSLIQQYKTALLEDIVNDNTVETDTFKLTVESNAIYQANSNYFMGITTQEDECDEQNFKSYWDKQGYPSYCAYLENGVKLSHSDVGAILRNKLNLPYALYDYVSATPLTSYETKANNPVFEAAINGGAGHYYLLKNEKTEQFLDEYKSQLGEYHKHRVKVQEIATNVSKEKVAQSKTYPAIFLAATLPRSVTYRDPIDLLLEEIQQLDEYILNSVDILSPIYDNEAIQRAVEELEQIEAVHSIDAITNLAENAEPELSSADSDPLEPTENPIERRNSEPFLRFGRQFKSSQNENKEGVAELPLRKIEDDEDLTQQIDKLEGHLSELEVKAREFETKLLPENLPTDLTEEELAEYKAKYEAARDAAQGLHSVIDTSLRIFSASEKTIHNFDVFKQACMDAVDIHRPVLEEHRDNNQFFANLIAAILGVGIIYGFVVLANAIYNKGYCTFFQTDSEKKVVTILNDIDELEAMVTAP